MSSVPVKTICFSVGNFLWHAGALISPHYPISITPPSFRLYLPKGLGGLFLAFLFLLCTRLAFAFGPTNGGGPGDGQTNVPVDALIDREFDLTLSGATVNTGTVLLRVNTGNTQGWAPTGNGLCTQTRVVNTSSSMQKIICEHAPLEGSKWHTITYTTGIKTGTGRALATAQSYTFQTNSFSGGGNFIPPPMIRNNVPRPGGSQPSNGKIRVYFRPGGSGTGATMKTTGTGSVLSPSSVQLFLDNNGQPTGSNLLACATVGGDPASPTDCNMAWNTATNELIITPGKQAPGGTVNTTGTALVAGTKYLLMLKAGQTSAALKNTNNIPMMLPSNMSEHIIQFSATGADTLGPTVKGSFPIGGATGVDHAMYNINVGFTEAIDPATVSGSSVFLYRDGGNDSYDSGSGDDVLITGTSVEYNTD